MLYTCQPSQNNVYYYGQFYLVHAQGGTYNPRDKIQALY